MSAAKATTAVVEKKRIGSSEISPVTNPEEYIHSSLIHEVYLNNDLKNDFPKFWGRTAFEEGGFGDFYQDIKEIVTNIKSLTGKKLDHSQTVSDIINPVLKALGWGNAKEVLVGSNLIITNKSGDEISIKPTFTLFSNENDAKSFSKHYKSSTKPNDQFKFIPVATSYFGAWADQKSSKYDKAREQHGKFGDIFSALGTDEQAYNYADILNAEWCFSTDGHSWRLIKKSAFAVDHNKYFEFNFWGILNALSTAKPHEEDALAEILKSFYWFFSKESHLISKPNQISLTWERAKKYTDELEDDLRARFVASMSFAVNSLSRSAKKIKMEFEYDLLQDIAESLIYNTLFIRSCESRRVLPLHQTYLPVSLHNLLSKLKDFDPTQTMFPDSTQLRLDSVFKCKITEQGSELFDYLMALFELANNSEKKSNTFGFAIEGFKENIFSAKEWASLRKVKIDNLSCAQILSTLFYLKKDTQLPFNVLTPQQFGGIFESFLEFKLAKATSIQVLVKRRTKSDREIIWTDKQKSGDEIFYTTTIGGLYFSPVNKERKFSGSFFTPDHIVDQLVRDTIGDLIKGKTALQIADIRICDPAMGSGHFLISALRFLSSEYLKRSDSAKESPTSLKRKILHSCIFGVDINPRAVKLAKLALWLETAEPGRALEHLDDQFKCGDSLVDGLKGYNQAFDWHKAFGSKPFDLMIGNPPWITFMGKEKVSDHYSTEYTNHLLKTFPKSSGYKLNSYALFIERVIQLSGTRFRFSFVVPQTILDNQYNRDVREFLLNKSQQIDVNILGAEVFKDACVESISLSAFNKSDKSVAPGHVHIRSNLDDSKKFEYSIEEIQKDSGFKINHGVSSEENEADQEILAGNYSVDHLFKVYVGIVTGDNKKFLSKEKKNDDWRKILKGRDLGTMTLKWGGTFVLWKPNQLHSNTDESAHVVPLKILVRKTGNTIISAVDTSKMLTEQTIYNLIPKVSMQKIEADFYAFQLNSKFLDEIFKKHFITNADAYPYIKGIHLKKLPLLRFSDASISIKNKFAKFANSQKDGSTWEKNLDLEQEIRDALNLVIKKKAA